jgi:hypothetical protein
MVLSSFRMKETGLHKHSPTYLPFPHYPPHTQTPCDHIKIVKEGQAHACNSSHLRNRDWKIAAQCQPRQKGNETSISTDLNWVDATQEA